MSRSGVSLYVRGLCRHADYGNNEDSLMGDDAPSITLGAIHAITYRNQDWSHSLPMEPILFSPKPVSQQVRILNIYLRSALAFETSS